ncbi:MAG: type II secretion system protein GspL [Pseudomonadota bacterium]
MTSAATTAEPDKSFAGPPQVMRLARLAGAARGAGSAYATWHVDSAEPPPKGRFVALVPGAEAPLIDVDVPSTLRDSARETVARRQIADKLGLVLDDMELRPAPLEGAGASWRAMMMVRKTDMSGWRAHLEKQGRSVVALLPDYLALPTSADVWTILTQEDPKAAVRVRLGPTDGFTAEPALAALTLARGLDEDGRSSPKALLRIGPRVPELDDALDMTLSNHPGITRVESDEGLPDTVEAPATFGHGELALSLAVPQRDPRRDIEERLRGSLLPATLFLLAGIIWAGATFNDISDLREEARTAEDRNIALVREAFLPTGPLPDIRLQVIRLIEDRRTALANVGPDAEPPLIGLRRASAVLAGAVDEGVALNYADVQPDGIITLELAAPDFLAMELLLEQLREAGLQVEEGRSFTDDDGRVLADVTLLPSALAALDTEAAQ